MSLEQLRNVKATGVSSELESVINSLITVASQKALSARESPNAITVISEEEIRKSGARDLVDLLRLVPGFDFTYDGSNQVGIGVRGNWANEGKVLLQVDGVQTNEIFSGSTQFVNNFPIASIARIEIVRGPGSAIYGGFAELGVINIITKSGAEMNGGYITATYGQMKDGNARRTLNIGAGKKIQDLELSLSGVVGEGNLSDRQAFTRTSTTGPLQTTSNIKGKYQTMAGNSKSNPFFWNARIGYKGLSIRAIYDDYKSSVLSRTDSSGRRFLDKHSNAFSIETKYDWQVSHRLTLTPSLYFTTQSPKISNLPDTITLIQEKGERFRSALTANYDVNRKVNVVLGINYFTDKGTNDADSITTLNGSVKSIRYDDYAIFGQFTGRYRIANVVLGARYENNSKFGDAFVPRIALTKRIDKFHVKLLYSQSFRSPTIQNIARGVSNIQSVSAGINPERTTVGEIEIGYQPTRDLITTINFYDSYIKDPIVYISDLNLYTNLKKSGSKGIEFESRLKKKWGFVNLNYSFYTVTNRSRLDIYSTRQYAPGDTLGPTGGEANKNVLLAFPAHKVTLSANIALSNKLSVSPSLVWSSQRYGYDFKKSADETYQIYLRKDSPRLLGHLFLNWTTPLKGLDVSGGVYNVLNTKYDYFSPMSSNSSAPLPSGSREYSVRLMYVLKSKK